MSFTKAELDNMQKVIEDRADDFSNISQADIEEYYNFENFEKGFTDILEVIKQLKDGNLYD